MPRGRRRPAAAPALPGEAAAPSAAPSAAKTNIRQFHDALCLSHWALGMFRGRSADPLRAALDRPSLEGWDEESGGKQSKFFRALCEQSLFDFGEAGLVSKDVAADYDRRVVEFWKQIAAKRSAEAGRPLLPKYFQWLSLMATELYLDWYFNRRAELLAAVNAERDAVNANLPRGLRLENPILEEHLSKISFWEATGGGKTLLLNVNILQYRHWAKKAGAAIDKVILLTPNEGLTRQHLDELEKSGIAASELRDGDLFQNDAGVVGVVDAGKLISDESQRKKGDKSMLAAWFEGRNLVLVDEGHNGSSKEDGERRKVRDQLCRDGFSFEYSATFGQAVARGGRVKAADGGRSLWEIYATNILFDYSYKYFFEDGFGKEAFILNLQSGSDEEQVFAYLCGSLLNFTQQCILFERNPAVMRECGIARPLCLFVGNTVNASGKADADGASDVRKVVEFLARVLRDRAAVESLFGRFVRDEDVVTAGGRNVFRGQFLPLSGMSGADLYGAMMRLVFHAPAGVLLHACHRKAPGEIVLSCGTAAPFALLNIGDSATFVKSLEEARSTDFAVDAADDFSPSLFPEIDRDDSPLSILVGSRKFTEGWSSWRVSSIGLLNMGVNEGTQIIQLFGRGVRLRGRDFSLRRTKRGDPARSAFVDKLETLEIFGLRANYMAKFREYLDEEGVGTRDAMLELDFPSRRRPIPPSIRVPRLAAGFELDGPNGFRKKAVTLFDIPPGDARRIRDIRFSYRDFASVQALEHRTEGTGRADRAASVPAVTLDHRAYPFFDWDVIYRRLLAHKAEKGYRNLAISKERLRSFADSGDDWYELFADPVRMRFDSFEKLKHIQDVFETLVCGYADRFYDRLRRLHEDGHMELAPLTEDLMPESWHFEIDNTPDGEVWRNRIIELMHIIAAGAVPAEVRKWQLSGSGDFVAIVFDPLLYEPLLWTNSGARPKLPFTFRPVSLQAPSEKQFVEDFKRYYETHPVVFAGTDVFLMRNASDKLHGIGFAQGGGFYPDFLLWLVDKADGRQFLCFIDPKGLRNVPFDSPKMDFSQEVKNLEKAMNATASPPIVLNSVILSDTKCADLLNLFGHDAADYARKNVFFLDSGADAYIPQLLAAARRDASAAMPKPPVPEESAGGFLEAAEPPALYDGRRVGR